MEPYGLTETMTKHGLGLYIYHY